MRAAPMRHDEEARLAALYEYDALDGTADPVLDELVALTARLFDVPIALVSLVNRDEQVFAASCGISAKGTGRDISFCGHALGKTELLMVLSVQCELVSDRCTSV